MKVEVRYHGRKIQEGKSAVPSGQGEAVDNKADVKANGASVPWPVISAFLIILETLFYSLELGRE